MDEIKQKDKKYILGTYGRFDLHIVRGSGAECEDEQGKKYIDLGSGIGVNCLGYCDGGWVKAVEKQLETLQHTSNLYYTTPGAELAEALCERTGYKKVFFCNSGAEANEAAIKTARKYSFDKYGAGRDKIITLDKSFHGRTMATLTATAQEAMHNYFFPFNEGFVYCGKDIEEIKKQEGVCAVMLEFIQGEGGVIPQNKQFIAQVYDYCKKSDILFIADEVQTGVGRTGKFLCSEHYGVHPDVTTLAKGLGGGLPVGAMLVGEKCENVMGAGTHGSTFGGNPVVCAGGKYVLSRIDEKLLEEVAAKGEYIKSRLEGVKGVKSVSGLGLMLGIELDGKKAADVVKECMAKGVIPLTAKDRVRLLPPLIITMEQLARAMDVLVQVLPVSNPSRTL